VALLKGTLDVLVLKTLSWTPMHAYEIASWIDDQSTGRVAPDDAALLQALHRLEERKLLSAAWGVTTNGRRARYYKITPAGRAHLRDESTRLVDYFDALVTILTAKTAPRA
jgi:PadR family transcriptional regulator, regulatory protein PadR